MIQPMVVNYLNLATKRFNRSKKTPLCNSPVIFMLNSCLRTLEEKSTSMSFLQILLVKNEIRYHLRMINLVSTHTSLSHVSCTPHLIDQEISLQSCSNIFSFFSLLSMRKESYGVLSQELL